MAPRGVLLHFLVYLPQALSRWPAVNPTSGKKVLPKRGGLQETRETPMSFLSDSLGPLRRTLAPPPSPPQEEGTEFHAHFEVQGQGAHFHQKGAEPPFSPNPPSGSADPPKASPAQSSTEEFHTSIPEQAQPPPPPTEGRRRAPRTHARDWATTARVTRWTCRVCLCTTRAAHPPKQGCAGFCVEMRKAIMNPKCHNLLFSLFTDGIGMVLVCSRCGLYSASNRPCFPNPCVGVSSAGAESAYNCISQGMHPKHAEGQGKVLGPCLPTDLLKAGWPD